MLPIRTPWDWLWELTPPLPWESPSLSHALVGMLFGGSDGVNQPGLLLPTAKSMWPIGSSLKCTCPTKNCSGYEAVTLRPCYVPGRKEITVGSRCHLLVSGRSHACSCTLSLGAGTFGADRGGVGVWLPVNSSAAPQSQVG